MLKNANRISVSKLMMCSLTAFALAACHTATPQTDAEPQSFADGPALWTVQDHDTTLHLFGLAPVLKPGADWQSETFTEAFTSAELVVLEADNSSPEAQATVQALIPQLGVYTEGGSLSAVLSEKEREIVNAVSTQFGAPLQALNTLKPWLASVQLGVLSISASGFEMTNTPAASIAAMAEEADKRIDTLESPDQVLRILATFPEDEQIATLLHTARTIRDDPDQQARLAEAWLAGDVDAIGNILHDTMGAWSSEKAYDALLVQRNQEWVAHIKNLMADETGTVFVAVGFGHLAGEDSLINMLNAEGLSATRK